MADEETRSVELAARVLPDENGGPFATMAEAQARGHDTLTPVTGFYQLGVIDDGAFIPFFEDAWAAIQPRIEAAKAAAAAAAAADSTDAAAK